MLTLLVALLVTAPPQSPQWGDPNAPMPAATPPWRAWQVWALPSLHLPWWYSPGLGTPAILTGGSLMVCVPIEDPPAHLLRKAPDCCWQRCASVMDRPWERRDVPWAPELDAQ